MAIRSNFTVQTTVNLLTRNQQNQNAQTNSQHQEAFKHEDPRNGAIQDSGATKLKLQFNGQELSLRRLHVKRKSLLDSWCMGDTGRIHTHPVNLGKHGTSIQGEPAIQQSQWLARLSKAIICRNIGGHKGWQARSSGFQAFYRWIKHYHTHGRQQTSQYTKQTTHHTRNVQSIQGASTINMHSKQRGSGSEQ
ncbi:hypothetical protein BJV82DRAFT_664426 [Fennellomyces sp. T-0311]|nr:hypothetical protein BJV82DRAFT_664426 [Fennellomyces sp. T-0311]